MPDEKPLISLYLGGLYLGRYKKKLVNCWVVVDDDEEFCLGFVCWRERVKKKTGVEGGRFALLLSE